ncbi:MAG TPA: hypothetical protein VFS24_07445 [Steroidobacteraceae bacterium]|nr:hypothetical protein [Steroidobacteraceae bacterium]
MSNSSNDLVADLRAKADVAYLKYSDMLNSDLCRGTAAKLDAGKFKWENLQQFCKAHEELGRHRALYEALTALERVERDEPPFRPDMPA